MREKVAHSGYLSLREWAALVKFRLSMTVVFSAVMAYVIAAGEAFHWNQLILLATGGWLITAAANALNEVLERDYDKLMDRTKDRPLATERMDVSTAVLFAGFASLFGIVLLAMLNPIAAFLGMLSLVSYAFIYTPLKRKTAFSVLIGAIPGALPMAIGVVAAHGILTPLALLLFGIQFFWQFPHFWAIAWLAHEDYERAGFHLLPSKHKDAKVGLQSFLFCLMLLPLVVLMFTSGYVSWGTLIVLLLLSFGFAAAAWQLYRKCDRSSARKLMFSSLLYLPLFLIALVVDQCAF